MQFNKQNWKQNFQQTPNKYGPVYNKQINKSKEPKTQCLLCPLGPDVCNETGPTNILHGLKPRQYLNEAVIRRLLKMQENGELKVKSEKVVHPFPDNFSDIKTYAEGKLPCVYCKVNMCDRWDKDERVQHIYGTYYAWSTQDVENFIEVWMSTFQKKKPNMNSKTNVNHTDKIKHTQSQPKRSYLATSSASIPDAKPSDTNILEEIKQIRNDLQTHIQSKSDTKAKYDDISDETREQIRQEILLEMKQEKKYKKNNNKQKQTNVTSINPKFQIGLASQDVRQKMNQNNQINNNKSKNDTVPNQTKFKLPGRDLTDQTKELMADKKPIGTLFANTAS